jgi:hypothetical protein
MEGAQMKLIKDILNYDLLEFLLLITLSLLAVIVITSLLTDADDNEKWETFKRTHSCKVIVRISGDTQLGIGYGIAVNGQQMVIVLTPNTTPDKTGWICDDGVTYWR